MARLALEQAPAAALPRRFLLTMPMWGVAAAALLLAAGAAPLRSRWHPATLALVHAYTLGVLGNALLGSLLQFLPAAAGVRLRGARLGPWLHGLFNLGALLLVAGLHRGWRPGLLAAALLLPAAFALFGAMALPGLLRAAGQRLLRAGIGTALAFALGTALLVGLLALGYGGRLPLALPALADAHAGWGLLGWMLLLLASVGRVVLPMFQGTGVPPAPLQAAWLGALALLLPLAAAGRLMGEGVAGLRIALAACALVFTVAVTWLQRRTPPARRGPLWWSWRLGAIALAAAALLLAAGAGAAAGLLALGAALPALVAGMALEIVAFLAWIELHRRVGRGVQQPGVQRLLPARDKAAALLALLLCAAALHPADGLARLAALALGAAWIALGVAFAGAQWRARRFLLTVEAA